MSIDTRKRAETSQQDPAHAHAIRAGMTVRCQDASIGLVASLAPLWVEQPTHLVVRTGPLIQRELVLPLRWVAHVAQDQVVLQVRQRHLARIRPRLSDDLLHDAVRAALYSTPQFRADNVLRMIDVTVSDHAVTLRGNVRTVWRALLAETIVRQVRGVWDIQNLLIGDDELEDAVRQRLRREPRLHTSTFQIQAQLGQVTLRGTVRSGEDAALAVLLARRVPGVRAIDNEIVVSGTSKPTPSIDGPALLTRRRPIPVPAS